MALGARLRQIIGRVIGRLMLRTAIGFGAGVLCTALWDRVFPTPSASAGRRTRNPSRLVAAFLLGILVLAAIVPSRRASRVDPLVALRVE